MKQRLGIAGIVAAAILASSCCWIPLLLAGAGALGVGFAAALAPYRPYFIAATALLLAGAWYGLLRQRLAASAVSAEWCVGEPGCCRPGSFRRNIGMLAIVTAAALALLAIPEIEGAVLAHSRPHHADSMPTRGARTLSLQIRGWSCPACAAGVESQLSRLPGVIDARASYAANVVKVRVWPQQVHESQLRAAVAKLGYRVAAID